VWPLPVINVTIMIIIYIYIYMVVQVDMTYINFTWGPCFSLGIPVWPWPVINVTMITMAFSRQERGSLCRRKARCALSAVTVIETMLKGTEPKAQHWRGKG